MKRFDSIDALRGLVMVIMALDHVRDFTSFTADPGDPATTSTALFFTRWITHFCAPVFVFLAGTGAWLYGSKGRSRGALARFLVTRGLWLIVLEFTVVGFGWIFDTGARVLLLQVIAAIGVAMIALAGLVFLPPAAILATGLLIVGGHNLLDPIVPADLAPYGAVWKLLHEPPDFRPLPIGGYGLFVIYPLLPWIGVMALGYAFGPVMRREPPAVRRTCIGLGLAACVLFVALRWANGFGNGRPWGEQATVWRTALSFLNVQKYPPSLAFLSMTLGPALVLLGLLHRELGSVVRPLVVLGRVPLFYYVAHIYLGHLAGCLYFWVRDGHFHSIMASAFRTGRQPDWYTDAPLLHVYLVWAAVVVVLYPVCAWYAGLKARNRSWILSYL